MLLNWPTQARTITSLLSFICPVKGVHCMPGALLCLQSEVLPPPSRAFAWSAVPDISSQRQAAPCLSSLEDFECRFMSSNTLEGAKFCKGPDKTMTWCASVGINCHHQRCQKEDSTAKKCTQCPRGPCDISVAPRASAEAQQTIHHVLF